MIASLEVMTGEGAFHLFLAVEEKPNGLQSRLHTEGSAHLK